jgi:hypothetical protein
MSTLLAASPHRSYILKQFFIRTFVKPLLLLFKNIISVTCFSMSFYILQADDPSSPKLVRQADNTSDTWI